MKRGRPMTRGLDDAVAIARKRGCVMKFEYGLENTCDLMIRTATYIALVRLRRLDRIDAATSEIEHEVRDLIAELRLFPESVQIRREFWAYSRHGTYRLFGIRGTGLVELGRDGEPAGQAGNSGTPPGPEPGTDPGNGGGAGLETGNGKPAPSLTPSGEADSPSDKSPEKTCIPSPP